MAEQNICLAHKMDEPELVPSPTTWADCVLDNFDTFLSDHASCEKKASGMALNVAAHYPDKPVLLNAMVDLAVEELSHYREVMRLIMERRLTPAPDIRDTYVHTLNQQVRRGTQAFLLDRLLVGAVIERRGAERFAMLATRLEQVCNTDDSQPTPPSSNRLARFYQSIAASEERHWLLFCNLACEYFPVEQVSNRLIELTDAEGSIMLEQARAPTLHG